MLDRNQATDDAPQLTNAEYVADENVERYPDHTTDIAAIVRDDDRFGNVIGGLLFKPDKIWETMEIAYASRRNDCYNEDGSRPDWKVKASGTVVDVTDDLGEEEDVWDVDIDLRGEALEALLDSRYMDVEDYGTDDAGNIVITVYDHDRGRYNMTLVID